MVIPVKTITCIIAAVVLLVTWTSAFAGPPFRTDDPEPVPHHHGEVYLFSSGTRDAQDTSGVGPAIEFNYGIFPDTQLQTVIPITRLSIIHPEDFLTLPANGF